jgi:K+-transporting ATPase ATPase C chain
MLRDLSKSLWLLGFMVVLLCGIYPAVLWAIGQTLFPFQANGSLLRDPDGKPVGSLLIAQPFTRDEYFQPRPSAASYDGAASASSTLAPSNYLLRDRAARTLGPIAKYRSGPKRGQLVAPDIEVWFQADRYRGHPSLVAQWALAHSGLARAWVSADPTHRSFVDEWATTHPDVVARWVKDHPETPRPQASDLALVFFETFSKEHPGRFPSPVTHRATDGKAVTTVQPAKEGTDIQSVFFDMWRAEHPDEELQDVPGDMVTTSGSGLDPHITLENAAYQLDRVAATWALTTRRDPARIRGEIAQILRAKASAPFGGFAGEKLVNVLEVNLELRTRYGAPGT